jgi:phage N-6-adenine-methyltransferase
VNHSPREKQNTPWQTPPELFAEWRREFGLNRDLFASAENALCEDFYTEDDDAIMQPWSGRCFGNPPYGGHMQDETVTKALTEVRVTRRAEIVVLLLQGNTSSSWFKTVHDAAEVWLFRGRINFVVPPNVVIAGKKSSSKFANALVVVRPEGRSGIHGFRCPRTGRVLPPVNTLT